MNGSYTNKPFFSVITCTYNREDTILRALESLLDQTFENWECIIIDDASIDRTYEVILPYLSDKIKYHLFPHQGAAISKNMGIDLAKGQYITFLDSDDEYLNNHLELRHDILSKQPAIDLLHSNVHVIGSMFVPDKRDNSIQRHVNDCIIGGTFCVKRATLDENERYKNMYSEESDLYQGFVVRHKNILKINAPTYVYYRNNEDSICDTIEKQIINS